MKQYALSLSEKVTFEREWFKITNLLKRSRIDLSRIKLTAIMEVDKND